MIAKSTAMLALGIWAGFVLSSYLAPTINPMLANFKLALPTVTAV